MNKGKIKFVRGDTHLVSRYFADEEGNILKPNPSTDEINFTVRKSIESEIEELKKTISDMTINENGKYTIKINPTDTDKMEFGEYHYDIELRIGVNEEEPFVQTVESGIFKLLPYDYSRPTKNGGVE